jgi:hypothetical protein
MFLQFLLTTANSIVTEGVSCGYWITQKIK